MTPLFEGSIVALPTPFAEGALDLAAVDRLVGFQVRSCSNAVAIGGTTGEGWSLNVDESAQLAARAVEAAGAEGGPRVLAHIVEVDSRRAAQLAEQMVHAGVEGLFLSPPPHVQSGLEGLLRHLELVLERLPWPVKIALVNEPSRTGSDHTIEASEQAAREFPLVVAHCEGVGVPGRAKRLAKESFLDVLCGDDRMLGPYLRSGAVGALNAVGNLVPREVLRMIEAVREGDADADRVERALAPLVDALRAGPHPVALKESLGLLEALGAEVRPPLVSLGTTALGELRSTLELARLLVPEQLAS